MQKMLYTNIFSYLYFEDRNVSQELLGPHTHKKKIISKKIDIFIKMRLLLEIDLSKKFQRYDANIRYLFIYIYS